MWAIIDTGGGYTMTDRSDGEEDQYRSGGRDSGGHERERSRGTGFRSIYKLLKLTVFVTPLVIFLYGNFADCSARPATGWLGMIGAGACARNEMLSSALSLPDNFAVLKRLLD
jgi:hypothetical protein